MGCGDACPVFPGRKYLDWALEDPADKGVTAVRPIRDGSKSRVEALIAEIGAQRPDHVGPFGSLGEALVKPW